MFWPGPRTPRETQTSPHGDLWGPLLTQIAFLTYAGQWLTLARSFGAGLGIPSGPSLPPKTINYATDVLKDLSWGVHMAF